MSTTLAARRIIDGMHTYFDVCPESPDGRHLCCFRFDGPPLVHGTVLVCDRDGHDERTIATCTGQAHVGAHQGWLDDDHLYFSADGHLHVADADGRILQRMRGAVDTIDPATRRGLVHTHLRRQVGDDPGEEAVWRLDLDNERLVPLLDQAAASALCGDLSGVHGGDLRFKHAKWAPDGATWFVVFTNESRRDPSQRRVKVLIAADADGGNARLVGDFGHHPGWLPDGSGIYAFAGGRVNRLLRWDRRGGAPTVLAETPGEGHPCISPDAALVVFDCDAADRTDLIVQDLASGAHRVVATLPRPQAPWQTAHPPGRIGHAHPVWSRDGSRIYANSVEGERPILIAIDRPSF